MDLPSGLTDKQERFCQEYIIDLNAAGAARRAGYSEKTDDEMGYENLRKPQIVERIAELQSIRAKNVELDQEWVLRGLKENYERAMQLEPCKDAKGEPTGEYVYNGAVANRSLELVGKHLAMFTEKIEENGEKKLRIVFGDDV